MLSKQERRRRILTAILVTVFLEFLWAFMGESAPDGTRMTISFAAGLFYQFYLRRWF